MDEEKIPNKICEKCIEIITSLHSLRDESIKNDVLFRSSEYQQKILKHEKDESEQKNSYSNNFSESFNENVSCSSYPEVSNEDGEINDSQEEIFEKSEDRFKCQHCEASFKFLSNLNQHKRRFHRNMEYENKWYMRSAKCPVCGLVIPQATNLKRHVIQYHDSSLKIKCPKCTYRFSNLKGLKLHGFKFHNISDIHPAKESSADKKIYIYECDLCECKFLEKDSLEKHIYRKHIRMSFLYKSSQGMNKMNHQCDYCDRTFSVRSNLFRHYQQAHSKELPFQCEQCNEGFRIEQAYAKHMARVHLIVNLNIIKNPEARVPVSAEQKLICEFCSEDCGNSKYRYERHLVVMHENEVNEMLRCPMCNKNFVFKESLSQHIAWHERMNVEKTYEFACEICSKRFPCEEKLEKHKMNNHIAESSLICDICGKKLRNKTSLNFHIKRHSEKREHQCPQCPQSFVYIKELERHINSHVDSRKYACTHEGCNKRFNDLYILKLHNKRHAGLVERKFQCEYCDKRFTTKYALDRHVLTHTQERPHACEYCSMSYTQRNDLLKHLREHLGDNIYKCTFEGCNEGFRLKFDLKQHYAVHYLN